MTKIEFSIDAIIDLEKIHSYIEDEFNNHLSGSKIVTKIVKSINSLIDFPERGKALSVVVKIKTDYKYIVCSNYNIFYRVVNDKIYIIRIIHHSRNYISILF